MVENKNIGDYYVERYRKIIKFFNIALAIAALLLLINWLFALEPQFQKIRQARHQYKNQLKEAQKQLSYYSNILSRYYNRNLIDSQKNLQNKQRADTLAKQIQKLNKADLTDSLKDLQTKLDKYQSDSAYRATLLVKAKLFSDSVVKIRERKAEINSLKKAALNDNLKDYDWKSLIRFAFIVAAEPKDGSLYLMGLVTLMLITTFIARLLSLHYLAKALRIYKLESVQINSYNDLSIATPFWLAPLPTSRFNRKKNSSFKENNDDSLVEPGELAKILGVPNKGKYNLTMVVILLALFALQLRFFFISAYANPTLRFDFVFEAGIILCSLTLCQIIIWISPLFIDDHLNNEPPANNIARRFFISTSLALIIGYTLVRKTNRVAKYFDLNAKRYLRRKARNISAGENDIIAGLYCHSTNNLVSGSTPMYFFDEKGYSSVLKDIGSPEQLKKFKTKLLKLNFEDVMSSNKYAFSSNKRSEQIELYTLFLLKNNKKNQAVEFIFKQLTTPQATNLSEYRLFDLAIKIFIRFDNSGNYLKRFISHFENLTDLINEDDLFYAFNYSSTLKKKISNWRNRAWIKKISMKKHFSWHKIKI